MKFTPKALGAYIFIISTLTEKALTESRAVMDEVHSFQKDQKSI